MSLDKVAFNKKTFGSILEEIYDNQKKKEKQILGLIKELKPLVEDVGSATMVVPLIKGYMELGLKNDDQLVKVAQILQRVFAVESTGDDFKITEEERLQLLAEIKKIEEDNK